MCVIVPNFIKISQTVADIWRFNGFYNGGRPPSWICENRNFLMAGVVKRPILHQLPNFVKIGQTVADILRFLWFSSWRLPPSWIFKNSKFWRHFRCRGQYASPFQISSKSVKRLQTYGDLTVFKMAAVRHLGFVGRRLGPPAMSSWWSLSFCKTSLKSMQ